MIELADEDLNRMRLDTENNFVERKTVSDKRGWLHTAVAFANSVPIDYPAVLFVGVNNDGTLENVKLNHDWEKQQKTVSEELSRAYPPLYFLPKTLRDEQNREYLAVIVPGSAQRPHFTGKSYVRVGPETKEASEDQFENLIAQRLSKVYEILKWKQRMVTVDHMIRTPVPGHDPLQRTTEAIVIDCNQFWITLNTDQHHRVALPLPQVDLSFDPPKSRLKILHWQG